VSHTLKVTTWNAEWATLKDARGQQIAKILHETDSDLIVLTEGCRSLLPADGYIVEGSDDWGYQTSDPARRKVILWSRHAVTQPDTIGNPSMPAGRFVSGIVALNNQTLNAVGVCIPWSAAHVHTGKKDREPWQDHNLYLEHLAQILKTCPSPLIVAGDFNQRLPRQRQPIDSHKLLVTAFQNLKIHTEGYTQPALIDHIATTKNFNTKSLKLIARDLNGIRLSDHDGVSVTFEW
jgi:hypothetical protein